MKKSIQLFLAALFFAFAAINSVTYAVDRYSVATGTWVSTSTWSATSGGAPGATAPGASDNVIIEGGFTVTLDANKSATNVTVKTGSILDAATFSLTVSGTFTLEGGSEFRQGGSVTGVPGATRSFATTSTYTYNGTQAGLAGTPPTFGNLNFAPSPTAAGTFAVALAVAGNMTINLGTAQEIRFSTGTTGRTHSITGNLIIQGSSIVVGSNGSSTVGSATITVGGNLNITAGTFRGTNDVGNATFNIAGNISNGGTWQQDDGSSTGTFGINLNGSSSSQDISGANPISFEDLTINNSSGVTLSRSVNVTSTLTLTSGKITTTSSNLLTMSSSATVSGGSALSFVDGPMAHTWSTLTATKTFPLGKGSTYRPLDITLTTPASPVLRAEVFNGNAGGSKGSMNAISTVRYYQTSLFSGTATSGGNVKITFDSDDGVTDHSTLVVGQSTTATGTYSSLGRSTSTTSSVTSSSYNPASGDYLLLGDETGTNPLPVQLISFLAYTNNKTVSLSWRTATEVNNYGFEIQRLAVSDKLLANSQEQNANSWSKIGFVNGHGNSNSPKNYSFTDEPYGGKVFKYRLKQIDFDGAFEYSDEVTAVFEDVTTFALEQNYPNPFNPSTKISYTIPQRSNVKLRVYNMLAQLEAELVNDSQEAGHYQVIFNGGNLPSGTYFYKLEAGKFVQVKKFLLVK